jgi:hypothetical protein
MQEILINQDVNIHRATKQAMVKKTVLKRKFGEANDANTRQLMCHNPFYGAEKMN